MNSQNLERTYLDVLSNLLILCKLISTQQSSNNLSETSWRDAVDFKEAVSSSWTFLYQKKKNVEMDINVKDLRLFINILNFVSWNGQLASSTLRELYCTVMRYVLNKNWANIFQVYRSDSVTKRDSSFLSTPPSLSSSRKWLEPRSYILGWSPGRSNSIQVYLSLFGSVLRLLIFPNVVWKQADEL